MKLLKSVMLCMFFTLIIAGLAQAVEIGGLDASFGNEGRVATTLGLYQDLAYAVTVQPDGKILVAGSSANGSNLDFALVRYNEDGTLDRTFNLDGTVTTQIGRDDDEIAALAVQENGYIIAAGYSVNNGSRDFSLARYMPDGELDYSFGQGGVVVTDYGSMDDEITAMAVDTEGRIVVAGYSTGTAGRAVVIARYLPGGVLDLTFGYEGMSLTGIGDDAIARSIDVDDLGRIVVAGSYSYEQRAEVMVLRFTDDGELDSDFGTDGLAVSSYALSSTEGFGVKVHESGEILVAGSVGDAGELDTALFMFAENGQPEITFGENGMMVTEASQGDDMALAVDTHGDSISLSGFATMDGERQFLFVSHLLEVLQPERVSFSLKTGNSTTSLSVNERQDVDYSYNDFQPDSKSGTMEIVQTVVSTTPFGSFSDNISYAVTLQDDGKAVAAGFTEQNGVASFAVARYEAIADELDLTATIAGAGVSWITTKEPFEVTRTGAISGGTINNSAVSITKRGVVFSIAPDPVLKEGTDSPDNPPPGDSAPVRSGSDIKLLDGETTGTLSVQTSTTSNCRYSTQANTPYDSMTLSLVTTDNFTHTKEVTTLQVGDHFYVRCEDIATKDQNSSDFDIEVIEDLVSGIGAIKAMGMYANSVGSLFVSTAHAQTLVDGTSDTTTSSTGIFDFSSSDYLTEGNTEDGAGSGSYSSIMTNLKPGTFFYVRAYALSSDGEVFYGNQLGFNTADSCFVATAAYGSIFHPYVKVLRDFRDQYLLTSAPGQVFVNAYYRYSPPAADFISRHPFARQIVQIVLLPFVGLGWLLVQFGAALLLLMVPVVLVSGIFAHRSWRRTHAV